MSHKSVAKTWHCNACLRLLTGYARVSTDNQDRRLQRSLLTKAGCRRIFEEKGSGAHHDRPELARLLDQIRADDVVVVTLGNLLTSMM